MWKYAPSDYNPSAIILQESLNRPEGIYIMVDGRAGRMASDAFKTVAGHYLEGDPRGSQV